jgi:hypothetical protein
MKQIFKVSKVEVFKQHHLKTIGTLCQLLGTIIGLRLLIWVY